MDIREEDLRGAEATADDRVQLAYVDAGRGVRHQDQAEAPVPLGTGAREDGDDGVRQVRSGTEDLVPVEHPVIVVEDGPRLHRRRVRAGPRFGDRDAELRPAGEEAWQVLLALLGRAVVGDVRRGEHGGHHARGKIEAELRHGLTEDRVHHRVGVEPALLLEDEQPQPAPVRNLLVSLVGKLPGLVVLADVLPPYLALHERVQCVSPQLLFLGESEVHPCTLRQHRGPISVC